MNGENMRRTGSARLQVISKNCNPSRFSHLTLIAGAMTTVLTLLLIVLIGSALLGIRGYWS